MGLVLGHEHQIRNVRTARNVNFIVSALYTEFCGLERGSAVRLVADHLNRHGTLSTVTEENGSVNTYDMKSTKGPEYTFSIAMSFNLET